MDTITKLLNSKSIRMNISRNNRSWRRGGRKIVDCTKVAQNGNAITLSDTVLLSNVKLAIFLKFKGKSQENNNRRGSFFLKPSQH